MHLLAKIVAISTILGAVIAVMVYVNNLQNEKREIEFLIGGHSINKNGMTELIYLCPTSQLKQRNFFCIFPLAIKNGCKNSIEELSLFMVSYKSRFVDVEELSKKENAIIKRTKFEDPDSKKEIIKLDIGILNPKIRFNIPEVFNVDTTFVTKENGLDYTPVKDHIDMLLNYSYKNMKEENTSHISITVYNYETIEQFIKEEFEKNGILSSVASVYDSKKKQYMLPDKYIIIQPSFKVNNNTELLEIDYSGTMNIFQIKYSAKDYYKKRKLVVSDNQGEVIKTYNFPDLSIEQRDKIKSRMKLSHPDADRIILMNKNITLNLVCF